MKRLFIACALLFSLLGCSVLAGMKVQKLSDQYIQQLSAAQQLAQRDNWEQARSITKDVFSDWEKHHFLLHALLRHSDTDQILLSFRGVEEYLKLEETDQYVAANAQLITQLELMADMEQATLGNVL